MVGYTLPSPSFFCLLSPPPPFTHWQQTDRTVPHPTPSHTDNRQDCSPPPPPTTDRTVPPLHTLTTNRQDCSPPHPFTHWQQTGLFPPSPPPDNKQTGLFLPPPPPPPPARQQTDRTVPPPPPPFTHWQQTDGHWSLCFLRSLEFSDCNEEWQRRQDRRKSLHGL